MATQGVHDIPKRAFWAVVEECLVEFHRFSVADARRKSKEVRAKLEAPPEGLSGEMVYHSEPFTVACNIAKANLSISKHRRKYDAISAKHDW